MTGRAEPPLALFSPAGAAHPARVVEDSVTQVRLLTWNVQHANAARTRRQAVWLATEDPHDVLALTEVAAGDTGALLARLLSEFGYSVYLPEVIGDRYRVLVACRTGTLDVLTDPGVDVLPHRCVAARIVLPQTELGVVGLYVPSRGAKDQRNVAKRAFQDAVAAALPGLVTRLGVSGPVLAAGDLNVVEPEHEPRYPVFGQWEYDFYRSFAKAGLTDAFRLTQPTGMDYSWYGRPSGDGRRNGYRFDHCFITAAHADKVHDCRYVHAIREDGLSDHAAMSLTIAV